MDDGIYLAIRLASAARSALSGGDFSFSLADYMDKAVFRCFPRKKSIFGGFSTDKADIWYDHCEASGLCSVYADFAFDSSCTPAVYCAFDDGSYTRFVITTKVKKNRRFEVGYMGSAYWSNSVMPAIGVEWEYGSWYRVRAYFNEIPAEPFTKHYTDNTAELRAALQQAEELAMRLNGSSAAFAGESARLFGEAVQLLDGKQINRVNQFTSLPQLSEHGLRLYRACETAEIYDPRLGHRWRIHAKETADELGLSHEYEAVTSELLKQAKNALLYAVNSSLHTEISVE